MNKERGQRRRAFGVVTSDKMDKTIVVESTSSRPDPRYGKFVKSVTKYRAHDEANDAKAGDRVELIESRRASKTKAWRLVRVLERAPKAE